MRAPESTFESCKSELILFFGNFIFSSVSGPCILPYRKSKALGLNNFLRVFFFLGGGGLITGVKKLFRNDDEIKRL